MKCNFFILLLIFIQFPSITHANLRELEREYFQKNLTLKQNLKKRESFFYDLERTIQKRPLSLMYNGSLTDSKLDSSSTLANRNANTTIHSLSFIKDFIWGGQLKFENTFYKEERDLTNTALLFGGDRTAQEFSQGVSYNQKLGKNFFGRIDFLERDLAEQVLKGATAQEELENEQDFLEFLNHYVIASMSKSFLDLQNKALERAGRRTELIQKMVRDGLKLQVDYLQAKMSQIGQSEAVISAQEELKNSLGNFSQYLHREVSESEIIKIEEEEFSFNSQHTNDLSKNKSLIFVSQNLLSADLAKRMIKSGIFPDIDLNLKYKTNEIDKTSSKAFSDGNLLNDKKETVVALNLIWPLGFGPNKAELSKKNVEIQSLNYQKEKIENNLKQLLNTSWNKLELLNENLKNVKERVTLARSVLKKFNELYNLGKKELDQVIRAEEDLIRTETSFATYLGKKAQLLAVLNQLKGTLVEQRQKVLGEK